VKFINDGLAAGSLKPALSRRRFLSESSSPSRYLESNQPGGSGGRHGFLSAAPADARVNSSSTDHSRFLA